MRPGSSQPPERREAADNASLNAAASDAPEWDQRWNGAVITADRWHFHRRLLERYGVVLRPADYSRIARSIAHGETTLIEPKPDGTTVYLVRVPSSGALVFVAAKPTGELITALSVNSRLIHLTTLAARK